MLTVRPFGFMLFVALLACLWYRVARSLRRWKLMLAANAVFYLSMDIGSAVCALPYATAVVWQAALHPAARAAQPPRVDGTGAGRGTGSRCCCSEYCGYAGAGVLAADLV